MNKKHRYISMHFCPYCGNELEECLDCFLCQECDEVLKNKDIVTLKKKISIESDGVMCKYLIYPDSMTPKQVCNSCGKWRFITNKNGLCNYCEDENNA